MSKDTNKKIKSLSTSKTSKLSSVKASSSKTGKHSSTKTSSNKLKSSKGGSLNDKVKSSNSSNSLLEERYFKLIDPKNKQSFGRYTGATPKQAASKAYTKLLQKLKQSGGSIPKTTTLYLRESTRNSPKKVYGYAASRIKLTEPQQLTIKDKVTGSDKTITYNYRNKIKKIAVPEELAGGRGSKVGKSKLDKKTKGTEKAYKKGNVKDERKKNGQEKKKQNKQKSDKNGGSKTSKKSSLKSKSSKSK